MIRYKQLEALNDLIEGINKSSGDCGIRVFTNNKNYVKFQVENLEREGYTEIRKVYT